MIKQEKIRNAVILPGFGSVRNYHVHQVGNRELFPKDVLVKNPTAPADIAGMSGFVVDGRVHPYLTLANADKAFGGHLEPDTTVFTFAVVTLGVTGRRTEPHEDRRLDLSARRAIWLVSQEPISDNSRVSAKCHDSTARQRDSGGFALCGERSFRDPDGNLLEVVTPGGVADLLGQGLSGC
jgi:predicted DNA-binding protein with PD1-like motif